MYTVLRQYLDAILIKHLENISRGIYYILGSPTLQFCTLHSRASSIRIYSIYRETRHRWPYIKETEWHLREISLAF